MEINITDLVNSVEPRRYSASIAETGLTDIGQVTWENAMSDVAPDGEFVILKSEDERIAAREWLKGFGAWEDAEIDGWTSQEVDALLLQYISGDIRSGDDNRLFTGDDGQIYFYIGI
jgi:hypothetical protein